MTESLPSKPLPAAFAQHNQQQAERTVQLTQKAVEQLKVAGKRVTLAALCEATRQVDAKGKGLSAITILRNPEAAALFHQHSPGVQARQKLASKAQRKRVRVNTDTRALYRGLRAPDLIPMIEALKTQLAAVQQQQAKLVLERAEAYQLRDAALKQNTQQLAALTVLLAERTAKPAH